MVDTPGLDHNVRSLTTGMLSQAFWFSKREVRI